MTIVGGGALVSPGEELVECVGSAAPRSVHFRDFRILSAKDVADITVRVGPAPTTVDQSNCPLASTFGRQLITTATTAGTAVVAGSDVSTISAGEEVVMNIHVVNPTTETYMTSTSVQVLDLDTTCHGSLGGITQDWSAAPGEETDVCAGMTAAQDITFSSVRWSNSAGLYEAVLSLGSPDAGCADGPTIVSRVQTPGFVVAPLAAPVTVHAGEFIKLRVHLVNTTDQSVNGVTTVDLVQWRLRHDPRGRVWRPFRGLGRSDLSTAPLLLRQRRPQKQQIGLILRTSWSAVARRAAIRPEPRSPSRRRRLNARRVRGSRDT